MADADPSLAALKGIPKDHIPVNFVSAKAGDIIKLGGITCRVMEDGSRTGNEDLVLWYPEQYTDMILCYHR
jgi:hypothetical protein